MLESVIEVYLFEKRDKSKVRLRFEGRGFPSSVTTQQSAFVSEVQMRDNVKRFVHLTLKPDVARSAS